MRALKFGASIIAILAVIGTIVAWTNRREIFRRFEERQLLGSKQSRVFLVAGLDAGGRADTINLVVIAGGSVTLLGIPRDIVTDIGAKLTEVAGANGMPGLAKEIQKMLALETTPEFLGIRMNALPSWIDRHLPGGIPIDVGVDMNYVDKAGHLEIHLKKGRQLLHGHETVLFLRYRSTASANMGRLQRQFQAFRAIGGRMKRKSNAERKAAIQDLLSSNHSNLELAEAERMLVLLTISPLKFSSFEPQNARERHRDIQRLDLKQARASVRLAMKGALPDRETILRVLNGTDTPGLARAAAHKVSGALNLKVSDLGHSPKRRKRTTIIFYPGSTANAAQSAADALGVDAKFECAEPRDGHYATIIIEIGSDWKATK